MPRKNGMIGLAHRGARLVDPRRHLANLLRGAGYRTALSGVQHEFRHDEVGQAYDEVLAGHEGAHKDPEKANAAAAFLRRDHDKPFFLACGFVTTHRLGGREMQYFKHGDRTSGDPAGVTVPPGLPDNVETRQDIADFNESLDRLDDCVRRVIDAIDFDNTLLILTTDHGVPFPGYKSRLTDRGTGVLLILRGPPATGLVGGKRIGATVSHLDVLPTIAELVGLEMPDDLDGKSLLPLVRGERDRLHEVLYGEMNYHAAYEPMRSVRTADYLYVRHFGGLGHKVLGNCDPGLTREKLIAEGWGDAPPATEELYDLAADPDQLQNLAEDAEHAQTLEDLRQKLADRMRATDDPLLTLGEVPRPPGLVVTPVDAKYAADVEK
jgi:arylsulfatase A-like enzyme